MEKRRARSNRVRPEHEGLIRLIRSIAQEEDELSAPKIGTVTGEEGGRVKVRVDGEDGDRRAGLARSLGHSYPKGTRVRIERLRSGGRTRGSYDEVVTGIISEGTGKNRQVIADDDIIDGTITGKSIGENAIGAKNIARNAITADELAGGAVKQNNIEAGAVTKAKLDQSLQNTLDNALSKSDVKGSLGGKDNVKLATTADIDDVKGKIPTDYLKSNDIKDMATKTWANGQFISSKDLKALERELKDYIDSKTKGKSKP